MANSKQLFHRGDIHKADRTITFVINFWQDNNDKEKIWMSSNGILAPTEVNNHTNSVNYHPKMFKRLREILIQEERWIEENKD